ncbi:Retrovirus-related Pol polyprotein from transposon gypsy [Eumeta japonica]|uniref:RNA-directed DNA polymerase n=1 Tax=Eumeta variegata TaxID=151549 RepID=A0A4C1T9Y8_EUMVA|nr:Retrovirus-related Pol polyprotein from transposon gypsy [Eumeta japonica]
MNSDHEKGNSCSEIKKFFMSKRRQSNFDNNRLSLEKKPSTNPQISMEALTQQIARMQLTIENLVSKNQQLENRVSQLPTNPLAPVAIQPLQAINMTYNSPVEINLDIFKSLPEFKGNQLEYRSWRKIATLYGNPIKDLEHAYAIARTIEHDNEHRRLNLTYGENGYEQRKPSNYHFQQRCENQMRPNIKTTHQQIQSTSTQQPSVEPMDTTSSNTRQRWNNHNTYRQPQQGYHPRRNFNTAYKRPGGSSGMYQQPKTLRLNNMTTEDDLIVETGDNAAELNVSGQRNNVNIHLRNGLPCINLSDGNKEYQVLIDTGASHNYVKPETMFNKHERLENYKYVYSVHGGHYEYKRMPRFENAPAIFQRCVDEILREHIGKFAYVYIDDVLIYSSSPEEHMKHIEIIIKALNEATLRISIEKSKFFQTEVEYLGHVVKHGKICTNPEKVEAIEKLPIPENLKELRGFLGMTGYYRKFVKNYASIAKPLTIHLRGENGAVTRNQSKKTKITLDQPAIDAFNKLKKCLKEQVELQQPKVDKPFEITTDASNIALGAVLSQQGKPIAFISRTLTSTEENYSTNEKELLAIIWALQKLRNYVYGSPDLTIFTDHQSLTFSVSDRNPNTKLKRWKNIIEEYGAKLI